MKTKSEQLTDLVNTLRRDTPHVLGATVVSDEGFILAAALPTNADAAQVGDLSASLFDVSKRVAAQLWSSGLEQSFVRCTQGSFVINTAGTHTMLVLQLGPEAKLGLILQQIKRSLAELIRLL